MLDFFGFSFSRFSAFCWDAINIPGKSLILLRPALKPSPVGSGQSLGLASLGTTAEGHPRPPPPAPGALCLGRRGLSPSLPGPSCCPGPLGAVVSPPAPDFPAAFGSQHKTPLLNPGRSRGFAWVSSLSCSLDMLGPLPGLPCFPARRTHSLLCAACCLMTEKCLIF